MPLAICLITLGIASGPQAGVLAQSPGGAKLMEDRVMNSSSSGADHEITVPKSAEDLFRNLKNSIVSDYLIDNSFYTEESLLKFSGGGAVNFNNPKMESSIYEGRIFSFLALKGSNNLPYASIDFYVSRSNTCRNGSSQITSVIYFNQLFKGIEGEANVVVSALGDEFQMSDSPYLIRNPPPRDGNATISMGVSPASNALGNKTLGYTFETAKTISHVAVITDPAGNVIRVTAEQTAKC